VPSKPFGAAINDTLRPRARPPVLKARSKSYFDTMRMARV
jgi:hypothetical protein